MESEETMSEVETVSETDANSQSQTPKTARLAIWSIVFGILAPFFCAPMLILLFYGLSFRNLLIQSPYRTTSFSCVVAGILGLVLGLKSLEQINDSQGLLAGREYAIAGIAISISWILLILAVLFLPALYYVNS